MASLNTGLALDFAALDKALCSKIEDQPGIRTLAHTMVSDHLVRIQLGEHPIYRFFLHSGAEWEFLAFGVVLDTNAGSFVKATGCTNVGRAQT